MPELINQFKEAKQLEDVKAEQNKIVLSFGENLTLTILAPVLLFIISFYCALGISKYYHYKTFMIENPFGVYLGNVRISAFDMATIPIWAIYIFSIIYIEKRLYKKRGNSKYFNKPLHKTLFYLSIILTVVATIIFLLSVRVQLFSRVGRSTREGFMVNLFFLTYTLPTILWIVYYLAIKESNIIYWLPKIYLKRKSVSKRAEAVKQLKEAKELLDLGILSKSEYDEKAEKLKPIILDN